MIVKRLISGKGRRACLAAGLVTASALAMTSAAAQEDTVRLETIYLKAGTDKDGETVTDERIAQRQPLTLNDLYAAEPEVHVSGADRSTAQRVYVRGIEETSLNVTVDGARQSGNLFRHNGNMGIDPFMLKRVEVEAGTGGALAGPGALGGAIRYETKDAEDLLLPGQRQGVMLRFAGQSNGDRLLPSLGFYGRPDERFSYLIYGSKTWAGNYKDGGGNAVPYSDDEPAEGLVKLRFRPAPDHEIALTHNRREDNGMRATQANFGLPDAEPQDQEFIRETTSLRYSYAPAGNPLIDLELRAYDNRSALKRLTASPSEGEWLTSGLDIRNRSELGALVLTYGYDYTREQSRGRAGSGPRVSETGETHGLYLQAEYGFAGHWLASGGLRYDSASLTDLAGNVYDGDHLSPNVGLRFETAQGLSLFASWSEAHRGVRPVPGTQLTSGINAAATDPTLEGERARTTEIGAAFDANGWRAGLILFDTRIEGSILYGGQRGMPYARTRGGDIDSRGFTARLGRDWGDWSLDLSYSRADVDYAGVPVGPGDWSNGVAPQGDKLVLDIAHAMAAHDLQFAWTSILVLAEDDLPATFTALEELPGYAVHDLSVVWRPAEGQEYSLAIQNIFDKRYLDHSTPYSVSGGVTNLYEMGRSIRLAGGWRF